MSDAWFTVFCELLPIADLFKLAVVEFVLLLTFVDTLSLIFDSSVLSDWLFRELPKIKYVLINIRISPDSKIYLVKNNIAFAVAYYSGLTYVFDFPYFVQNLIHFDNWQVFVLVQDTFETTKKNKYNVNYLQIHINFVK